MIDTTGITTDTMVLTIITVTAATNTPSYPSPPKAERGFAELILNLSPGSIIPFSVATGKSRRDHSLHEPTYNLAPGKPACSKASKVWQAVTPDPQCTITCPGLTSPKAF